MHNINLKYKLVTDIKNNFFTNNRFIAAESLPAEGDFVKGDLIVNIGENANDEAMWLCVESGNPGVWEVVGAGAGGGSSKIVTLKSRVVVNEALSEVNIGVSGFNKATDTLIVFNNARFMVEGVDYEINADSTKIVAMNGNIWNEELANNFIFDFVVFKMMNVNENGEVVVSSANEIVKLKNIVIVNEAVNEVEIGIDGFNEGDDLTVYKNSVYMMEGIDYEINADSDKIILNEACAVGSIFAFEVIKTVAKINPDAVVGMEHLNEDVREAIKAAGNIDLSGYATKEEMNGKVAQGDYNTKIAELEGRVEEAFTSANNGKQLIASAIGNPLITGNSTFNAMSEAILGYENNLRIILTDEGVSTSDEDNMDSLIAKVDSEFDRQVVPQGNANANQVLQGSTFMNSSGQLQAGTVPYLQSNIPNVTEYTANHYMTDDAVVADLSGLGGNCLYFAMPTGVYNTVGWLMSYTPNLIPENIVSGVNILGVTGNATVGSLGGRQFNSGTVTVSGGTQSINIPVGFTPSLIMGVHVDDSGYPLISVCSIYATYFTCRINGTCKNTSNGGSINGSNVVLPLQWQTYNANNTYTLTWYAYS